MELHELRYFLTLSRTLNFTKAAELCHVSQPALTRAIHKLENELGGLLFSRERKNTHLTDLGKLIEPHVAEVIAREGKAKQEAVRFLSLENAGLTIGIMRSIAPLPFVKLLNRFRSNNPGVVVTLLEAMPERLRDLLVAGDLDVALLAHPEGFASPLKAHELYTERFVVACATDHRFASQASVQMHEMDGEFYLSHTDCEACDILVELCRAHGAKLRRSFHSEREDWILAMVAAGMGVCFLPEYTASFPGISGRRLVAPEVARTVCLVTIAGRRRSAPLATFIQAVRSYSWPSGAPPKP